MASLKKLRDAESLCNSGIHENINKSIKLYKELCLSNLDPFDKNKIMSSFWKNVKDEAREMLIRWRDMIPFVKGDALAALTKLLLLICENRDIEDHERSITAVHLYNQGFLHVCFRGFESIALDDRCNLDYRIDACRFLIGSEQDENKELAQECLLQIINGDSPSERRYKIIAGFISRTGISTYLNTTKIKIPYDENFVYSLQMSFFENRENGVRERILSGQHILGMQEAATSEDKKGVVAELLSIANNQENEENIRADAADVILRLGGAEESKTARDIIIKLGYSGLGKSSDTQPSDRIKTIYNNSQNMHNEKIEESVSKYIEKLIEGYATTKRPTFERVLTGVIQLVKDRGYTQKQKHSVKAALNRISIDTATFTSLKVTLCDILSCVWMKIAEFDKDEDMKKLLEDRLLEELSEMGPTCSSGHSGRFVNVLSAVDDTLRISFEDQIIANVAGRINAKIKAIPDEDMKMSIHAGMFPQADDEDAKIYKDFMKNTITDLEKELRKEFVGDGYVKEEEFRFYFDKAVKEWTI